MDKKLVHYAFVELLASRITQCEAVLADIGHSSQSETKSSAGDKYETSREMLQQEENKVNQQLEKLYFQKKELRSIRDVGAIDQVGWGSLVATDKGTFYISTSLGKVDLPQEGMIYAISKVSPMAMALFGKRVGDQAMLMDRRVNILTLF